MCILKGLWAPVLFTCLLLLSNSGIRLLLALWSDGYVHLANYIRLKCRSSKIIDCSKIALLPSTAGVHGLEGGWEAVKETLDQTINALRTVGTVFLDAFHVPSQAQY